MNTRNQTLAAATSKTSKSAWPRRIDGTDGDDFILVAGDAPTFVNALGGNDTISTFGDALHVIYGGGGDDTININGTGAVQAHGHGDDDRFNVNTRADHGLHGGDGWDIADFSGLYGETQYDFGAVFDLENNEVGNWPFFQAPFSITLNDIEEIYGTHGIDYVIGSENDDIFHGVAGEDTFFGNGGNDAFHAGDDDVEAEGGQGDDILEGGAGRDTLSGGSGDDTIRGGEGKDILRGGSGNDVIHADDGTYDYDVVLAFDENGERDSGNDTFYGNAGDMLSYDESDVAIYLNTALGVAARRFDNDDSIGLDSFSGFTEFLGSAHSDFLRTSTTSQWWEDDETVWGGAGSDTFYASSGDDVYFGDYGWTDGSASYGSDTVDYSSFFTAVSVDLAANRAEVSIYDHRIHEIENVVGSQVADVIKGDKWDNRIDGNEGSDTLTGREGADTFVFARGDTGRVGNDIVTDFETGTDRIMFDDLTLLDGTSVSDASDLDVNGDRVVDQYDGTAIVNSNGTFLLFDEGIVRFDGLYGVSVDDMMFA